MMHCSNLILPEHNVGKRQGEMVPRKQKKYKNIKNKWRDGPTFGPSVWNYFGAVTKYALKGLYEMRMFDSNVKLLYMDNFIDVKIKTFIISYYC